MPALKRSNSASIIVINYKTTELVVNLLKKLGDISHHEVIIIDHSPTDELKKKLPVSSEIKYFFQNKNFGFAAGNNFGIQKAKYDWLFLLNSDAQVTVNEIDTLIQITNEKGYLVSTPKLIGKDKTVQNTVGFFQTFWKNPINYTFLRPYFLDCSSIHKQTKVDLATGASLLVHKSIFEKIGAFDDKNYFMYFEDIDWSYKLYKNKISILYIPEVKLLHFGGASSENSARKNQQYNQSLRSYLLKNRSWLIMKINNLFSFLN